MNAQIVLAPGEHLITFEDLKAYKTHHSKKANVDLENAQYKISIIGHNSSIINQIGDNFQFLVPISMQIENLTFVNSCGEDGQTKSLFRFTVDSQKLLIKNSTLMNINIKQDQSSEVIIESSTLLSCSGDNPLL